MCSKKRRLNKTEYVIWFSSSHELNSKENMYGYWDGRNYTHHGELIPSTNKVITEETKRYKSRKKAEQGLVDCLERNYTHVANWEIREIKRREQWKKKW